MLDTTGFAHPKPRDQKGASRQSRFDKQEREFRRQVWEREGGCSRLTGQPLSKWDDDWDRLGDVCHILPKSVYPERRFDPENAVLLSRNEHILSDGRGGYLLKILGSKASLPLRFERYNHHGILLWVVVR